MKQKFFAALAAAFVGMITLPLGLAADRDQQVKVYMYSEYIEPGMPAEFEKLTGLKCKIDVYENSEEMMAKMQAGGAGQYDVVVVSDVNVPAMVNLKLVQPLDYARIANAKNISDHFKTPPFDPGAKYSLPYQWGTVGLIYNKEKVKTSNISWGLIFDEKQQVGPYVLMDSMRDMIGIALKYQGHGMSSTSKDELKSAADILLAAKKGKHSLGFEGGVGGKNKVAAGEATMAVVYNGDAIRAVAEDPKLGFAVPKEGGVIWVDVMMVTAKAPNMAGAHKFINYILDAQAGAKLSNFNRYPTPNAASLPLIEEKDRNDPAIYPPMDIVKKLEYLVDLGENTRLYDETWTMIKAR